VTNGDRTMNRGGFVKFAAAGGLAIATPLATAQRARAGTSIAVKVGVLVPTGSSYASMGRSLVDGLTLGFDDERTGSSAVNPAFAQRDVERGYDGASAAATELLDGGADVVVAGVSALVADRLAALFAERQASLVVADVGAHVVQPAAQNKNVLHNSLLLWQSSFAAGQWAAATVGKTAFLAATVGDAGYDALFAFRRGFESGGGTIVGDAVTGAGATSPSLAEVMAAIRASGASIVYGLYSGARAAEFVQAYAGSGLGATLVTGSLAVEDFLLSSIGSAAAGATSCASWTSTRSTRANQAFTKAFKTRYGRSADPFAALGYDTAALVAEGARRATKQGLGLRRLIEALAGVSLDGPRGTLVVDATANTVTGPLWMRQVKRTVNGLANVDVAQAPNVAAFPGALSPLTADPRSGYLNEYLCA
jgi:branched-chain amino acid transport system substrate-binding protein